MPLAQILKIGLSGAVGGFVAVLADSIQKEQASAVAQIAQVLQKMFGKAIPPLIPVLLVLGLAVALCFIFEAGTTKKAFYLGASILSIMMTLVPYKVPPSTPTAAAEARPPGSGLGADGASPRPLIIPASASPLAAQSMRPGSGVAVTLTTDDNKNLPEVLITFRDANSGEAVAQYSAKTNYVVFDKLPAGEYTMRLAAPGYRVVEDTVRVLSGKISYLSIELKSSWVPLGVQQLFQGVVDYGKVVQQGPSTVQVKLDGIQVLQDGSPGSTAWTFEVFGNSRRLFSLPQKSYTDANQLSQIEDKPEASLTVAPGQNIDLEVLGYRSASVEGRLAIPRDLDGQASWHGDLPVLALTSRPKDGDFVCKFSLTRRQEAAFQVELGEINARQDGSPGETFWAFDVFLNDKRLLRVPAKPYTDSKGQYLIRPTLTGEADMRDSGSRDLELRVLGYRLSSVEGKVSLPWVTRVQSTRNVQVPVSALTKERRDGDFVFSFTFLTPRGALFNERPVPGLYADIPWGRPVQPTHPSKRWEDCRSLEERRLLSASEGGLCARIQRQHRAGQS